LLLAVPVDGDRTALVLSKLDEQKQSLDEQKQSLDEQKQSLDGIQHGVQQQGQQQARLQELRQDAAFFSGQSTHRSGESQAQFKSQLVARYNNGMKRQKGSSSRWETLRCLITGVELKYADCIAGHLVPHSSPQSLPEFGLRASDINSARNGMLWAQGIEDEFHPPGKVCIIHNFLVNKLVFFVLDPQLLQTTISGTKKKFREVHEKEIRVTQEQFPYLRFLWRHAVASVTEASNKHPEWGISLEDEKWKVPIESMKHYIDKIAEEGCNSAEAMRNTPSPPDTRRKRKSPEGMSAADGTAGGAAGGTGGVVSLKSRSRK
jgi:hypothetical protein